MHIYDQDSMNIELQLIFLCSSKQTFSHPMCTQEAAIKKAWFCLVIAGIIVIQIKITMNKNSHHMSGTKDLSPENGTPCVLEPRGLVLGSWNGSTPQREESGPASQCSSLEPGTSDSWQDALGGPCARQQGQKHSKKEKIRTCVLPAAAGTGLWQDAVGGQEEGRRGLREYAGQPMKDVREHPSPSGLSQCRHLSVFPNQRVNLSSVH